MPKKRNKTQKQKPITEPTDREEKGTKRYPNLKEPTRHQSQIPVPKNRNKANVTLHSNKALEEEEVKITPNYERTPYQKETDWYPIIQEIYKYQRTKSEPEESNGTDEDPKKPTKPLEDKPKYLEVTQDPECNQIKRKIIPSRTINKDIEQDIIKPRFYEEVEINPKAGKRIFDIVQAIESTEEDFPITLIPQTKNARPLVANRPREGTVKKIPTNYPPLTREILREAQNEDELCQLVLDMLQNKPLRYNISASNEKRLKALEPYMTLEQGIIVNRSHTEDTNEIMTRPLAPLRLIQHIAYALHNSNFHQGMTRTAKLVDRNYYRPKILGIPNMHTMLKPYLGDCDECPKKVSVHISHPFPMLLNPIPTRPRLVYIFDFWGPCQKSLETEIVNNTLKYTGRAFTYILVAKDMFSGLTYLYPTQKQTGSEAANLLTTIISQQGVPIAIKSDNHSVFKSKVLQDMCTELGIKQHFPIPYRPQSQATVERVMIQISDALKVDKEKDGWHRIIPYLQLVLNNSYNRMLDDSSFHVHYGTDPVLPHHIIHPIGEPLPNPKGYGKQLQENLTKIQRDILPKLIESRIKEHNYFNNKRKRQREINEGDVVQMKLPLSKGTASKNHSVWVGFFRVLNIDGRECVIKTKGGRQIYATHPDRVIRASNDFTKKLIHWLRAQKEHTKEMKELEIEQEDIYKQKIPKMNNEQNKQEPPYPNQLAICDIPNRKETKHKKEIEKRIDNRTPITKGDPRNPTHRQMNYLW